MLYIRYSKNHHEMTKLGALPYIDLLTIIRNDHGLCLWLYYITISFYFMTNYPYIAFSLNSQPAKRLHRNYSFSIVQFFNKAGAY